MKKSFIVFAALLFGLCLPGGAQVFILNDNIFAERMSEIKAAVVDSLSGEPVPFASVYVIPSKDTTITNFTLSDAKGEATLDEVPFGSYVFHVEMMGYKPFVKERFFRDAQVDMGTIRLQQDERFLQAAVISDIGNPIVVKQDTVEFNASSFRVGANAMLKDLLQRMPGMEITEDGKVSFNGQQIDKLTVGGRTFFFDDQSAALNNLPAAVVDKIRVIDRESESTRATGFQDGNREKVLDVALKKEYEQGWFGNLGFKGGATLENGDDPLRDNRGGLYSVNTLASAYSEKDQLTLISNAQNVDDPDGVVFIAVSADGDVASSTDQGLSTAAQLGVNVNSSRIKDVETTVSANYKYTDTQTGTRSARTTHEDGGDLFSVTDNSGQNIANSLSTNLEFDKESGKVWFHFRPSFGYSRSEGSEAGTSETSRLGETVNMSESSSSSSSRTRNANISADLSFRDLWGKKGRVLYFSGGGGYHTSDALSDQLSILHTASGKEENRLLNYVSDGMGYSADAQVRLTEPLSEKFTLSTTASMDFSRSNDTRDAYDASGLNDYYSSESRKRMLSQVYDLSVQYRFTQTSYLTLGASINGSLDETYSRSYGIAETTGEGDWYWFTSPTVRVSHSKGNDRITFSAGGYSRRPGLSQMLPVLDISNPSRLSTGNIYLKPYGYETITATWTRNNRERFSNTSVILTTSINSRPVTYARWYDADGVLVSIPVNSRTPSINSRILGNYSTPLDKKKLWSLSMYLSAQYSQSTNYQAKGTQEGLDKERFDYNSFMSGFWGDESGSRFYGGQSGFVGSETRVFYPEGSVSFRYNHEQLSLSAGTYLNGRIARYSLDPGLDMNTLATELNARASYTTMKEWEFSTDIAYVTYKGYTAGYDAPEWHWNAGIVKSIGAFNLSLDLHDILDQTRNLSHTVTANYEQDTYRLIMGRYVLFGVKWNFGKMNAVHSQRAQSAALNMVF